MTALKLHTTQNFYIVLKIVHCLLGLDLSYPRKEQRLGLRLLLYIYIDIHNMYKYTCLKVCMFIHTMYISIYIYTPWYNRYHVLCPQNFTENEAQTNIMYNICLILGLLLGLGRGCAGASEVGPRPREVRAPVDAVPAWLAREVAVQAAVRRRRLYVYHIYIYIGVTSESFAHI